MKTNPYRPARRSRRSVIVVIGLVLIAGIVLLATRHDKPTVAEQKSTTSHAALTVTTATATTASWPQTLQASGAIVAWQEAIIGSEISGQRLIEVRVNVGDRVKKGDVLARFNPDTLQAEQAQMLATWSQAESDRKRTESLKGSGAISAQQIENYRNTAASNLAQLKAKNLQVRYATVVAPADGSISARTATLGAIGSAGGELFRLIVSDRLEWRGELNAAQLAQAKREQLVQLTLPDSTTAKAKIRQLSPALDANTRLAIAYADILPGSHAHAGMYANGTVMMDTQNALVVPASSVVIRDGHAYVFTLASTDMEPKVTMQPVMTGLTQNNDMEILSGLKEGNLVVVQGAGFLNDGDTVRIANTVGEAK